MSGSGPTAQATAGTPQAIASSATKPAGSYVGVHATTSADRSNSGFRRRWRARARVAGRRPAGISGKARTSASKPLPGNIFPTPTTRCSPLRAACGPFGVNAWTRNHGGARAWAAHPNQFGRLAGTARRDPRDGSGQLRFHTAPEPVRAQPVKRQHRRQVELACHELGRDTGHPEVGMRDIGAILVQVAARDRANGPMAGSTSSSERRRGGPADT